MRLRFALLSLVFVAPMLALAQGTYPDRPVKLIVAFPRRHDGHRRAPRRAEDVGDGGGKTIGDREQGRRSGTIGTGESIAAAPDGYTAHHRQQPDARHQSNAVLEAFVRTSSRT